MGSGASRSARHRRPAARSARLGESLAASAPRIDAQCASRSRTLV